MTNIITLGPTNPIEGNKNQTSNQITDDNSENNNNTFVDEVMINNKKVLNISLEH